jgi:plasmid replication initiation protein
MTPKKISNKGIKLIKKSNDLIEARYKFDIWETRIFTSVLGLIAREDEDFRVYRIYLRDIIKDFDIKNGNAYDLLREASNNLMDKKFYLDYEVEGVDRKKIYHIIRSVDYMTQVKDEQKRSLNEYIDVSIDPDMKPLLLHLKEQFTTYDVRNIIKFKSSYTVRIYEHLKQYERVKHRRMDVDYLKRVFEINDEYPLFANFYQKVIEPAFRDINEHTDLTITDIEKIKEGRKVTALHFWFHRKEDHYFEKSSKKTRQLELPMVVNEPLVEVPTERPKTKIDILYLQFQERVVDGMGVTPTTFLEELRHKTAEQVETAIRITEETRRKGEISNVAGFFMQALRQGFTDQKEQKKVKIRQSAAEKVQKIRDAEILNQAVNDKIRQLVVQDPSITERAMQAVLETKIGQLRLRKLDIEVPNIEDFRSDVVLRDLVKDAIVLAHKKDFESILVNNSIF